MANHSYQIWNIARIRLADLSSDISHSSFNIPHFSLDLRRSSSHSCRMVQGTSTSS